MELLRITPKPPIGLAFEISDLLLLQGWAKFHELRMVVELDHWVEGEEYEEVVSFYAKDSSLRRWILWRSVNEIIVQPLIGRTSRFGSLAEGLDRLLGIQPDCQARCPPAARKIARPRRSTSHSRTARRTKCSAEVGNGGPAAVSASPAVQ
jgi:hypothetical protein